MNTSKLTNDPLTFLNLDTQKPFTTGAVPQDDFTGALEKASTVSLNTVNFSRMVSQDEAAKAQEKLGNMFGRACWLSSIALLQESNGSFYVRVNVTMVSVEIERTVPRTLDGVPVVLQRAGRARAF